MAKLPDTQLWAWLDVHAATSLPPPPGPKRVNKGQLLLPSYLSSAKPSTTAALRVQDRQLANLDLTSLRQGNSRELLRQFVRASPDLSAAVAAYVRTGIPNKFTVVARNLDRSCNREATAAVQQVVSRLGVLPDYSIGFDDAPTIRSLAETWGREIVTQGCMMGELVLDKALLPYKIQPVSSLQVKFYPSADGKRLIPKQELGGTTINLDVPSFFTVWLDQDPLEAYATSPIEPAVRAVVFGESFMNDLRRVIRRAIHPRVVVTVNEEKLRSAVPEGMLPEEVQTWLMSTLMDIEQKIQGLEPEDALVVFDSIGVEIKDHGRANLTGEYEAIKSIVDAQLTSGSKALPTVLGQRSAGANVASTETLLFMKYVEGTVTAKLNEMFSKILTFAVRLMGYDVQVEFAFADIDMRPSSELEAFRAMKQSRILELLSLGLITDDEAALELTGNLPPDGYVPRTGTDFQSKAAQPVGNGYNGASNDGSAANKAMKSDAPKNAKSENGGKKGNQ